MDRQKVWDTSYSSSRSKGYSVNDAKTIASRVASSWKEPVSGNRSLVANSNYMISDNIMDVLVGYPDSGAEEGLQDSLDMSGFENFTPKKVKADLEHFNHDFASGRPNHLDEKWHDFLLDAELYKKGNEIRAKVQVPDTELGKEFVEDYKVGKYGASIEYDGYKDGQKVVDWKITGFSFTKDPHYNQTRPKTAEHTSETSE